MHKLCLAVCVGIFLPLAALAHVTPNVTLVRRGDFVKQALPSATKFFEETLGAPVLAAVQRGSGWTPSPEETKVYVGRDDKGSLVGSVVFEWIPSQHGPVGLGVAFGPAGNILEATVTDVGTEPLVWVHPLLKDGRLAALSGLALSAAPDAARIAAGASGSMVQYYAGVIAGGVARAQALERALREARQH